MKKSDWIKVEGEDELRPGSFKHDASGSCGREHIFFIVREVKSIGGCPSPHVDVDCPRAWEICAPTCDDSPLPGNQYCLADAVKHGRIFRLRGLDTTTERTRTKQAAPAAAR